MASASSDLDQAPIQEADPSDIAAVETASTSIPTDSEAQVDSDTSTTAALSALNLKTKEEDDESKTQRSVNAAVVESASERTEQNSALLPAQPEAFKTPVLGTDDDDEGSRARNTSRAAAGDPSTQFPSPSSGFVPPVTQEDFRLHSVPASASKAGRRKSQTPPTPTGKVRQADAAAKAAAKTVEAKSSSSSPHQERRTQILRDSSSSSLLSSSSSSSSPFDDGNSEAISARSSPSTVAPQRRRSSASPVQGSSVSQRDSLEPGRIPLKIRDYAFDEVDPRHVGARDITAPSPREDRFRLQAEEEEEIELGEEEDGEMYQDQGGLPLGLYHAAYAFSAESEHELSVQAGEKLRLIGHVEGGWAIVIRIKEGEEDVVGNAEDMSSDDKGLVPEAYLEWLS